jgi:hypothetical protein
MFSLVFVLKKNKQVEFHNKLLFTFPASLNSICPKKTIALMGQLLQSEAKVNLLIKC